MTIEAVSIALREHIRRVAIVTHITHPQLIKTNKTLVLQWLNMGKSVLPACRSALLLGTITNGNALIQPVYVKVPHFQYTWVFLSLFHSE